MGLFAYTKRSYIWGHMLSKVILVSIGGENAWPIFNSGFSCNNTHPVLSHWYWHPAKKSSTLLFYSFTFSSFSGSQNEVPTCRITSVWDWLYRPAPPFVKINRILSVEKDVLGLDATHWLLRGQHITHGGDVDIVPVCILDINSENKSWHYQFASAFSRTDKKLVLLSKMILAAFYICDSKSSDQTQFPHIFFSKVESFSVYITLLRTLSSSYCCRWSV